MNSLPADAATVILARPCPDPEVKDIEVLLVLRNRKSSFVPGYYVFPGGVLDPGDFEPGVERCMTGLDPQEAARLLADMSPPAKALGAWIAGIRETFEEVGVLIARTKDGSPVAIEAEEDRRRFGRYRQELIEGKIKFVRMLEEEGMVLSGNDLHYFSHWITPEFLPKRYDVRFFAAEVPPGQIAVCDGVELTDQRWMRPRAALADYEAGRIGMVLPQIITLQELSRFRTPGEVIDSARKRHIPATLTKIIQMDGKEVEVMPDGTVFKNRPPVYP
jgi:8-oxo-dGTP pyrophosphatase MutT (NUDIX family)